MSSDSDYAIRARGLCKSYRIYPQPVDRLKQLLWGRWRRYYRQFDAVRGIDLDVRRGETLGVIGRNGSGKSTLLRMLCGIVEPSAGTVEVSGHVAPILALGVGMNPEFTGRENVRMNAAVLGISPDQLEERLEDVIAFADIGNFFDEPVRSYSSGMVSRLAFAVAIHSDPDILVIDEILAVGDEAFARKCFGRIESLKSEGSTILFVSHASNLVAQLCDRALLIETGERVAIGDPKTVLASYHRLLHAAPGDRPAIIQELRDGEARTGVRTGETDVVSVDHPSQTRASFDPELRPVTTAEYPSLGARICNARLLDEQDRPVNILHARATYQYAYDVVFDEPAFGVRFGMMIKLLTGFELGGQVSHSWARGIEVVDAGTVAEVRFRFRALLVPDVYFLNAGVLGLREGGEVYLHRVLDALMFRVEPFSGSHATGQVDLSEGLAQVEITVGRDDRSASVARSNSHA